MSKFARVWDRNFALLYTFEPGEDYSRLPDLGHPLAHAIRSADPDQPVFLTVDDDESGERWSGRLENWRSVVTENRIRGVELSWLEDKSMPLLVWPTPEDYATPGFAPTIEGADWWIEGRRFQEIVRETADDGAIRVTLRPAA
ncbi:hypothetical protein [Nocardia flavorosea]|uniref:Uncharacterized protein n=1 Tax=Nocardia flavorosea TaxID=53429 RepID=A0A846YNM1_9NOCA|nr:hypothetical protein [Nocardia flavorosea]NKY60373.1 hypothetical protein [Nocardia flavorosea]